MVLPLALDETEQELNGRASHLEARNRETRPVAGG